MNDVEAKASSARSRSTNPAARNASGPRSIPPKWPPRAVGEPTIAIVSVMAPRIAPTRPGAGAAVPAQLDYWLLDGSALLWHYLRMTSSTLLRDGRIRVETVIDAPFDEVWRHTQEPQLHRRWDARFSDIRYLPRPSL